MAVLEVGEACGGGFLVLALDDLADVLYVCIELRCGLSDDRGNGGTEKPVGFIPSVLWYFHRDGESVRQLLHNPSVDLRIHAPP